MTLEELKDISLIAYNFLKDFSGDNFKDGRHDISDGVYVNICSYETTARENAMFEAHRKYIDIQYMVEGKELITVEPLDAMRQGECIQRYSEDGDAELYKMNIYGTDLLLKKGEALVFSPDQAHAPGICVNSPEKVRKVIVKVPFKENLSYEE